MTSDHLYNDGDACRLPLTADPSLLGALWTAFGREFFIAGIFRFVGDQAAVFTPVLMLYLIRFIATEPSSTGIEGTGYAMV